MKPLKLFHLYTYFNDVLEKLAKRLRNWPITKLENTEDDDLVLDNSFLQTLMDRMMEALQERIAKKDSFWPRICFDIVPSLQPNFVNIADINAAIAKIVGNQKDVISHLLGFVPLDHVKPKEKVAKTTKQITKQTTLHYAKTVIKRENAKKEDKAEEEEEQEEQIVIHKKKKKKICDETIIKQQEGNFATASYAGIYFSYDGDKPSCAPMVIRKGIDQKNCGRWLKLNEERTRLVLDDDYDEQPNVHVQDFEIVGEFEDGIVPDDMIYYFVHSGRVRHLFRNSKAKIIQNIGHWLTTTQLIKWEKWARHPQWDSDRPFA